MKQLSTFVFFLFSLSLFAQNAPNPCLQADTVRIVVIGSSTAAGAGASTADSAWVNRYRAHLQSINPANEVINLAQGGYSTYQLMPTGFIPPAGKPAPDINRNITQALNQNPDAIIINLPSNDAASGNGTTVQLANFDSMVTVAALQNVPVWVCTTQPRNFANASQIQIQQEVRDSILSIYGNHALDFWTDIVDSTDRYINPLYNSGDGVHLNNIGHRLIFEVAREANIPLSVYSPSPTPDFALFDLQILNPAACGDSAQLIQLSSTNLGISSNSSLYLQIEWEDQFGINSFQDSLPTGLGTCAFDERTYSLNTYSGGDFEFRAYLTNSPDLNPSNDSQQIALSLSGHPDLTTWADSNCAGSAFELRAETGNNDHIFWYDAATGGNRLASGETFFIPNLQQSQSWYAEAVRGDLFYQDDLATTNISNINWNGCMFDLRAQEDIVLDSLVFKVNSLGAQAVNVFTRLGGYQGYELDRNAWNYIRTDSFFVNDPEDFQLVNLDSMVLNDGDTLGVYLEMTDPSTNLSYRSLSQPQTRSNNELEIFTGSGISHGFSQVYYPRDWNGRVFYHHGFRPEGDCQSERKEVMAKVVDSKDSFEPNDASFTAAPLPSTGIHKNASICGSNDHDWFYLTVGQKNHLRFELQHASADLDLLLYDANLQLLDFSAQSGIAEEHIILNQASIGARYYVQVLGESKAEGYRLFCQERSEPFMGNLQLSSASHQAIPLQQNLHLLYKSKRSTLNIQFHNEYSQYISIQIQNIQGQVIDRKKFISQIGKNEFDWHIGPVSAGCYWLLIQSESGQESRKFYVLK